MNIALDYDGTFTSDPNLWLRFILDAQAAGHTVDIVTMRYASECRNSSDFDGRLRALGCHVVCTSRLAKRPYAEACGRQYHIWIDDNPRAVEEDAAQIWSDPAPEGHPVVPDHNEHQQPASEPV